ncbi:MAG: hypothetical protein KME45_20850 [Stenomitos rutilans HA7619-LM2]|nr:hypothetical protein [Stenomitos rutilans HA7619-LM2]
MAGSSRNAAVTLSGWKTGCVNLSKSWHDRPSTPLLVRPAHRSLSLQLQRHSRGDRPSSRTAWHPIPYSLLPRPFKPIEIPLNDRCTVFIAKFHKEFQRLL